MRLITLPRAATAVVVCSCFAVAAQTPPPAQATRPAANPVLAKYKADLSADIDGMKDFTQQMVDQVFSFGELGFQEVETSKYLTGILRKNGFRIDESIAGIPTAWTATWGSGKPVIALGSDVDCIPQASQKPGVAYRDPIIEGAPGHGEGHNSGMPLNVTAALALKKIMERNRLGGTILLWPGIAEELLGTKAYFVRAGVFKDADVVLFAHVGSNLGVSWGDSAGNGLVSVEYSFKGESAHAGNFAWRGRSALDAAQLMDIGWNFRREHLRIQQRSHSVITNGGDQPNVVPSNATIWYYFRETDYEHIKEMWDIGNRMSKAAAMMTDTDVSMRVLGSAWPIHMNKTVAETMYANIKAVGLPQWSADDEKLARRAAAGAQGAGGRTRQGDSAAAGPRGDAGRGEARRRIGRHRRHLVERPDGDAQLSGEFRGRARAQLGERRGDGDAHRAQRRHGRREGPGDDRARPHDAARAREPRPPNYFRNVQTKSTKYTPLIRPDDKPAIWLNEQTMAKYRPEMKKYYYDPTRYKTYLEQLGITYPTVK